MLLPMLVGVVDGHTVARMCVASVTAVIVRDGRSHAPVREEHDAEHQRGEPLPHPACLPFGVDPDNRGKPLASQRFDGRARSSDRPGVDALAATRMDNLSIPVALSSEITIAIAPGRHNSTAGDDR